jgi:hypothetical protein
MGLTVACARCHDHKYDPIPTTDYYSLYSVFANIREPEDLPVIATGAAPADKLSRYEARLAKIRETDREYRAKRHAEMLSFFETQVPEYIAAAKDAASLSNTAIEDLVRDRNSTCMYSTAGATTCAGTRPSPPRTKGQYCRTRTGL